MRHCKKAKMATPESLLDPSDAVGRFPVMLSGDLTRYDSMQTASLCVLLARGLYQRRIAEGTIAPATSGGYKRSFRAYLERLAADGIVCAWVVLKGTPVLVLSDKRNVSVARELT